LPFLVDGQQDEEQLSAKQKKWEEGMRMSMDDTSNMTMAVR
jgi:hypothetical protein